MPLPSLLQKKTTRTHCIIYFTVHFVIIFLSSCYSSAYVDEEGGETAGNNRFMVDLPPLQKSLFWILENRPSAKLGFAALQDDSEKLDIMLINMYMDNDISPYWVTEFGPTRNAMALVSVLTKAEEDGLEPSRYRIDDILQLLHSRDTERLARLDIMLTLAMGTYVADMREGRAVTCLLDPKLFSAARDKEVNIQNVIREGLNAPDLIRFLQMQAPQHRDYQALKRLLAEYRRLEAAGGWPQIPEGSTLKPGAQDERVGVLARRLAITGDLPVLPDAEKIPVVTEPFFSSVLFSEVVPVDPIDPFEAPPQIYDNKLVKAVRHFQARYNLEQDGSVGRKTLAALNIPVRDHINKIILNMERWRWLPHRLNGRRILVNIAGFNLTGIKDEKPEISMPVIVGKVYHKTPVFSHIISYIEINPYWTIPPSIARNEIVKKMQSDPNYLKQQEIKIFSGWGRNSVEIAPTDIDWHSIDREIGRYRLRQDPGPRNALGRIKFMFPNSRNIYIHDTPGRDLFRRVKRSFSHGCIRVSEPLELAWYILRHDGQNISRKRLKKQIAGGERKIFNLRNPLPVHLLYRTVRVDPEDGTAHFYDDIYDRDALLAKALFTKDGKIDQCRYSYR